MRELLQAFATRKKAEQEEKDQQEVSTWPVAPFDMKNPIPQSPPFSVGSLTQYIYFVDI